jgi:hypothetical protein
MNVVKDLVKIEEWEGGFKTVFLPEGSDDKLARVAILQKGPDGQVVAAVKL